MMATMPTIIMMKPLTGSTERADAGCKIRIKGVGTLERSSRAGLPGSQVQSNAPAMEHVKAVRAQHQSVILQLSASGEGARGG